MLRAGEIVFSGKSTSVVYSIQMVSPENLHCTDWGCIYAFKNFYMCTCLCVCVKTMNEIEAMNLKEDKERSMRGVGGRKEKGKMM